MLKFAIPAAAALALATASPALADPVSGLQGSWANSSGPPAATQTAYAYCPPGKRVVGGGGAVSHDDVSIDSDIVLTRMQPVHPLNGQDYFVVSGTQTGGVLNGSWHVLADVKCADPVDGMHTVLTSTTLSSDSVQSAYPACPSGERVLGSGAWITQPTLGNVGLQAVRPLAGGVNAVVTAHEVAGGYNGNWNVLGYAVCAPEPDGYQVMTDQVGTNSVWEKDAEVECPAGKRALSGGGGLTSGAPGDVMLNAVTAWPTDYTTAYAQENTSTSASWGVIAKAVCADYY